MCRHCRIPGISRQASYSSPIGGRGPKGVQTLQDSRDQQASKLLISHWWERPKGCADTAGFQGSAGKQATHLPLVGEAQRVCRHCRIPGISRQASYSSPIGGRGPKGVQTLQDSRDQQASKLLISHWWERPKGCADTAGFQGSAGKQATHLPLMGEAQRVCRHCRIPGISRQASYSSPIGGRGPKGVQTLQDSRDQQASKLLISHWWERPKGCADTAGFQGSAGKQATHLPLVGEAQRVCRHCRIPGISRQASYSSPIGGRGPKGVQTLQDSRDQQASKLLISHWWERPKGCADTAGFQGSAGKQATHLPLVGEAQRVCRHCRIPGISRQASYSSPIDGRGPKGVKTLQDSRDQQASKLLISH